MQERSKNDCDALGLRLSTVVEQLARDDEEAVLLLEVRDQVLLRLISLHGHVLSVTPPSRARGKAGTGLSVFFCVNSARIQPPGAERAARTLSFFRIGLW